jgi:sugar phosphate isomerase/epimerase
MPPLRGIDASVASAFAADVTSVSPKPTSLGLLTYCFVLAQRARSELPDLPDYSDPLVFLREAARIGANAVQIPFGALTPEQIRAVRELSEAKGIALETTLVLPRSEADAGRFEAELRTLRELGVTIARTVVLPGRRYEQFPTLASYEAALAGAREQLRRAEPLVRRYGVRLAVENHKDQRMDERLRLLEEFSSEHIGACIDVGNNIALLEDPIEVVNALLPWTLTVHFKDQGLREYEDGFLLADVPLGEGCINLREVIRLIRDAKPQVRFHLELITRDPLKVPVLHESYWRTLPQVRAETLGRTLSLLKKESAQEPFPMVSTLPPRGRVEAERRNIEQSFRFAAAHLGFSI